MPEEMEGAAARKPGRFRGALPKKRRANLARVTRRRVRWEKPLATSVCAAALIWLAVNYGIIARLEKLRAAREALLEKQAQYQQAEETLHSYYASRDVYVHVTWADMTAEEIRLVDPSEVAALLERVVLPVSPLESVRVADNAAELSLTVRTLEEANMLARRLREEPLVEYCSVREESRETEPAETGRPVSCRLMVRFRDADNTNRAAGTGG